MSTKRRTRDPATCHPDRSLFSRGLCESCYVKLRQQERPIEQDRIRRGVRLCSRCQQEKPVDRFSKGQGRCKACKVAAVREYEQKHADDPNHREARRRASREWARRNRAYARNAHLVRTHGITSEEYDQLLKRQRGRCAICGRKPGGRVLAVDHDHATGRVRGLLCDSCNQALGFLNDDPKLLARALNYL